jgi:hypothetical protein
MTAHLMHGLLRVLHRGWQRGGDALHPAPRPTLLEALRDTYLTTAHTVTQVTRDAERMAYPQFRARLLRMAAETQAHVTWVRDALLARGGTLPTGACLPTEAHNGWDALRREMAAARHAYDALLEPMHLAEQADPALAAGFRRLRATTQQHRAGLLEMLVQSDPYALACDPAASARTRALAPTGPTRRYVAERLAEVARRQHAFRVPAPAAAGG